MIGTCMLSTLKVASFFFEWEEAKLFSTISLFCGSWFERDVCLFIFPLGFHAKWAVKLLHVQVTVWLIHIIWIFLRICTEHPGDQLSTQQVLPDYFSSSCTERMKNVRIINIFNHVCITLLPGSTVTVFIALYTWLKKDLVRSDLPFSHSRRPEQW